MSTEQVRTDDLLSNAQFRLALEAAPTGMLLIDERGCVAFANAHAEHLFGYAHAELLGKAVERLVPEPASARHSALREAFQQCPAARPMGGGRDLAGLRKDGSQVPIEIGLSPLETGGTRYVLAFVVDISERRQALLEREQLLSELRRLNVELEYRVTARTRALEAALREREVMLQEIHHRVKNNLAVVVSLLEMQTRTLEDQRDRDALNECQARVHAIALIHEKLYQSKDYANVPFSDYVRTLANDTFQALGAASSAVTLELSVEQVALAVDKAIPCGLILNELITNALKHAFPSNRRGRLRVELTARPSGQLRLVVADDGVGLPEGFEERGAHGLGLSLVSTLVKQLGAELTVESQGGTRFELRVT